MDSGVSLTLCRLRMKKARSYSFLQGKKNWNVIKAARLFLFCRWQKGSRASAVSAGSRGLSSVPGRSTIEPLRRVAWELIRIVSDCPLYPYPLKCDRGFCFSHKDISSSRNQFRGVNSLTVPEGGTTNLLGDDENTTNSSSDETEADDEGPRHNGR